MMMSVVFEFVSKRMKGLDEDAQATEGRIARDLEGRLAQNMRDVLVELGWCSRVLYIVVIYRRYIRSTP
jgi:hypothetical protein